MWKSVLCFHNVGSRDGMQVIRLSLSVIAHLICFKFIDYIILVSFESGNGKVILFRSLRDCISKVRSLDTSDSAFLR